MKLILKRILLCGSLLCSSINLFPAAASTHILDYRKGWFRKAHEALCVAAQAGDFRNVNVHINNIHEHGGQYFRDQFWDLNKFKPGTVLTQHHWDQGSRYIHHRFLEFLNTEQNGYTPFMYAILSNNENDQVIRRFLRFYKSRDILSGIDHETARHGSALALAAKLGKEVTFATILEFKNGKFTTTLPLLMAAALGGNVNIIQQVTNNICSRWHPRRTTKIRTFINQQDPTTGMTALMCAAQGNETGASIDSIRYLLELGADPTSTNHEHQTAADIARTAGHTDIVACIEAALPAAHTPDDDPRAPLLGRHVRISDASSASGDDSDKVAAAASCYQAPGCGTAMTE